MLKKYTKPEDWTIPFAVFFLCFISFMVVHMPRDGDFYFMVANGDYIIHHGFPKENPFVIHEGLKIVIQQWIPSVIIYWGSSHLWQFLVFEALCGIYLLTFVIYKLLSLSNPKNDSFLAATILVSCMAYLFIGKPMLYSMILLITQMYICEKRGSWLWLPLIVIAEANIHASFIAFHFVYLLPYIVPGLTKFLNDTAQYKYIKALPLMAVGAFINPYGLDGALYLFNSYGNELKSIEINELKTISIKSIAGVVAVLVLAFITIRLYQCYIKPKKPIDSHRFYLFAGSLLLLILFPQSRNHIFLLIGSIPLIATMLPKNVKGKKPPTKAMWVLAIGCIVALGIYMIQAPSMLPNSPENGVAYMKDKKDAVLYTVFDEGSYYEMNGIKVFFDARPELFFKKLNKKEDIVDDFLKMFTKDEKQMDEVLDKYQFTHMSVYKKTTYMHRYLKKKGYKVVAKDKEYLLYENPSYTQ